ncbi:MAG: TetR/AcrR family transcriptional regulator [Nocardioides sp.]|nr:TetR/AcrR family transcriptional regulator [Nocardioides sp.]
MVADVNAPPDVPPDARARLYAAAVQAFAAQGFHATTTRDIAGAAGMSPAALYVHHRSKEELLHLIALGGHRRTLALCQEAVGAGGGPVRALDRLVGDFVRHHADNPTTARVVNYELAALTPQHRVEIEALRSAIQTLVRDLIGDGVEAGVFATPDPMMTAAAVLSLGIDVARWYDETGWSADAVAEHYVGLVGRMVAAPAPAPDLTTAPPPAEERDRA